MKKLPTITLIVVLLAAITGCIRFLAVVGPIVIRVLQSLN